MYCRYKMYNLYFIFRETAKVTYLATLFDTQVAVDAQRLPRKFYQAMLVSEPISSFVYMYISAVVVIEGC